MSAIGAIKAEIDEHQAQRQEAAEALDLAQKELSAARLVFEKHQNRVMWLNDRIEALHKALGLLEDR